jgi:hypothetical protein
VRAIDVQHGVPKPDAPGTPVRIAAAADIDALVGLLVRAEVRAPRPQPFGAARYWLTLWLADGTTLGRPYFPESSELMGGLVLPAEFRRRLEAYLGPAPTP